MRLRWVAAMVAIGVFGASGCGGSGSDVVNPNGSVDGDWLGSFSETRLANASSGDLDIRYSQAGADISGTARLTVAPGGNSTSYLGSVAGTNAGGDVDATISFDPALPGGQTTVHVVGTVSGDSFSATYTSDGETGILNQIHFGKATAVMANGSVWTGTITDVSTGPTAFRINVASLAGVHFGGTSLAGTTVAGVVDGTQIGNRITFTATAGTTTFVCIGNVTNGVLTGLWSSTASHGTFTITKQSA